MLLHCLFCGGTIATWFCIFLCHFAEVWAACLIDCVRNKCLFPTLVVANPKYVAPPSLADKLREEVLEASGASGGGVSHEDRPYCNNEAGDSSAERRRVA